jgi:hypothetical protein
VGHHPTGWPGDACPGQRRGQEIVMLDLYSLALGDKLTPYAIRSLASHWPRVPRFSHGLIDQSSLGPVEVQGDCKARIMQWVMMAALLPHSFHGTVFTVHGAISLARGERCLSCSPVTGGKLDHPLQVNHVRLGTCCGH